MEKVEGRREVDELVVAGERGSELGSWAVQLTVERLREESSTDSG